MRLHSRSLARSLSTTNDYWRWSRVIFDDGPQRWPAHKKCQWLCMTNGYNPGCQKTSGSDDVKCEPYALFVVFTRSRSLSPMATRITSFRRALHRINPRLLLNLVTGISSALPRPNSSGSDSAKRLATLDIWMFLLFIGTSFRLMAPVMPQHYCGPMCKNCSYASRALHRMHSLGALRWSVSCS